MQVLYETRNQREYLKCGTKFVRRKFQDWKLLNQLINFCHSNNWSKLSVCCLKFISKSKHAPGTNSNKKVRNTKNIKSIQ